MSSPSVGNLIRKIRKQQKLNINQLGKAVGVSGSYIAKLETGERRFSLDLLSKITDQLGTSVTSLLSESGQSNRKLPVYRQANALAAVDGGKQPAEFYVDLPHLAAQQGFGVIADAESATATAYRNGDILLFSREDHYQPGDTVMYNFDGEARFTEWMPSGNGAERQNAFRQPEAQTVVARPSAKLIGVIQHLQR